MVQPRILNVVTGPENSIILHQKRTRDTVQNGLNSTMLKEK